WPMRVICSLRFRVLVFFFFQAEDGIRDGHVTGVQTCALPILERVFLDAGKVISTVTNLADEREYYTFHQGSTWTGSVHWRVRARSEERRVGKECRSWGSLRH